MGSRLDSASSGRRLQTAERLHQLARWVFWGLATALLGITPWLFGGNSSSGYYVAVWGGLMTAGSYARGLAGAVLDAGVRDIYEIRRDYDFPVISRSVSPGTTLGHYKTLGANLPVRCGGIDVRPGDIVVGDLDGVVVVPRERADEVLRMAQDIDRRELEQAKLIVEARSLKEGLAKYGRI